MLNHFLTFIIFLMIGVELRNGLSHIKEAILPSIAAIGGMLVPFLIFKVLEPQSELWATVMPTDVVLALGVLALIGKKAHPAVRVFLMTLAVADDFFTLLIMAIFYRQDLNLLDSFSTIGAALLGAIIPFSASFSKTLSRITSFAAIPLYIIINLFIGLDLASETFDLSSAIIAARVIGKVIGISLIVYLLTKFRLMKFSDGLNMNAIIGVGFLCGMGMTVSLVIADIATTSVTLLYQVRVGLFISAFISALLAMTWFRVFPGSVFFADQIRRNQ